METNATFKYAMLKVLERMGAAYRRGDLLEKRRLLMDAWAQFTKVKPGRSATVLQLERRN
jgi:hypothetical protein